MMRSSEILNVRLVEVIARLGHGQRLIVADAGLPCPNGVEVIDLAVRAGMPAFADVVALILSEGVFEAAVVADESVANPAFDSLAQRLSSLRMHRVSHEDFKRGSQEAAAIVRTGECTPFANIALISGVTF